MENYILSAVIYAFSSHDCFAIFFSFFPYKNTRIIAAATLIFPFYLLENKLLIFVYSPSVCIIATSVPVYAFDGSFWRGGKWCMYSLRLWDEILNFNFSYSCVLGSGVKTEWKKYSFAVVTGNNLLKKWNASFSPSL